MSWTTTPPDKPGWYWMRHPAGIPAKPTQIGRRPDGELIVLTRWVLSGNAVHLFQPEGFEWWPIPIQEPEGP